MEATPIRNTINYLKACRQYRVAGNPASYARDPKWLVNQAINRRAGWLEERHFRGTTQGVQGSLHVQPHFPRKARGDFQRLLHHIARLVNTPGVIVRESELGSARELLLARIPERFTEALE